MAGLIDVKVVGLPAFTARLARFAARIPGEMGDSLYRDMVAVMLESQGEVPYDEGDLHDSGEVDRANVSGASVSVSLHYGSASVDYAKIQHENLAYHHPHGGKAKFLIDPLERWNGDSSRRGAMVTRAFRAAR